MIQLPDSIRAEMNVWRAKNDAGLWVSVPDSYTKFHLEKASLDMEKRIHSGDWYVVEKKIVPDGRGDGFQVLEITIAEKVNEQWTINVLRWHESGAWFRRGAGWTRHKEMLKDE